MKILFIGKFKLNYFYLSRFWFIPENFDSGFFLFAENLGKTNILTFFLVFFNNPIHPENVATRLDFVFPSQTHQCGKRSSSSAVWLPISLSPCAHCHLPGQHWLLRSAFCSHWSLGILPELDRAIHRNADLMGIELFTFF